MNNVISANELKTRGVVALNQATANGDEAVITVRNKTAYVVLPIAKYNQLRECELASALRDVHDDLKQGRFNVESVDKHMKRLHRD